MKNAKKIFIPVALAAALSLSAFLVACGEKTPPATNNDKWRDESIWMTAEPLVPTNAAEIPEDIEYRAPLGSVHDPSVFHDPVSGYYYAYGTHFAVAKTYYLEDAFKNDKEGGWEQVEKEFDFSVLYGDEYITYNGNKWPRALEETVKLVQPNADLNTTWAPDVEYINGKYYMYYSLTKGFGYNTSAIGRVESNSPEGPFDNNVIIVDSMSNTAGKPNCIDPELFYDKEGKLWLVYGSDSGGIFIKELYNEGSKVGLPKEEGFGTKLWKGGKNQEGPFIYYNAATDYYYLMCSYNRLQVNYNMHVARSKNPNGPYVGIDGKDVASDGEGNLVAGNFKFNRSGKGTNGLAAMGHNSVVKDKDGKYFVIYHSRSLSGNTVNQPHNLYVNQLYFNEDGWPVMAPTSYVGETRGTFTEEQVAQEYEIVVHAMPADQSSGTSYKSTYVTSVNYTLAADGKVMSGQTQAGTWTLKDGYYAEITLKETRTVNGQATTVDIVYKGVVAPGWDTYASKVADQKGVITITAVSNEGISLWAIQK